MPTTTRTRRMLALTAVAIATLVNANSAKAEITGPYTSDANTLHLWHLDEADPGPAQPAAGITGSFDLDPVNGATLGNTSFAGFGTAADTNGGSNDGLQGSSVNISAMTGADGAFTMEALVNVSTISGKQGIIMMDASGGVSGRPFQFAIDDGNLQFIDIANGPQFLEAPIPTTGDDAFLADEWFHAAVTYDGNENTADNFKLYWTALDPLREEANEIFSGNLLNDLAGGSATFGVGNEFRGGPGENLEGLVDEVRISDIAREPDDFLFAVVPEPSSVAIWSLLGVVLTGFSYSRIRRTK